MWLTRMSVKHRLDESLRGPYRERDMREQTDVRVIGKQGSSTEICKRRRVLGRPFRTSQILAKLSETNEVVAPK